MAEPDDKPSEDVKAFDRLGNKIMVPQGQVSELEKMGGRVASPKDLKEAAAEAEYQKHSTAEKVAGYASAVLPFTAQNALSAAGVAPIRSEVESFNSGVSSAATLGLDEVAIKKALDETAGPEAGRAYGKHLLDAREANPGFNIAGQVVGTAAAAAMPTAGAARAFGGGVGALGGAVEGGVARALGGVAARGTLGRAAATGASLAARGATEGLLYGAANEVNEEQLGDKELAADKIFASAGYGALGGAVGGGLLGSGGSLAASGVRGTIGAARSGIQRALSRGGDAAEGAASKVGAAVDEGAAKIGQATDEAVEGAKAAVKRTASEAVDEVGKAASFAAEQTGTKASQEASAASSFLDKVGSKDAQKGYAYDQAWKAIGAGNGLQSTSFAKSAERYLPNGVKDVGEAILRHKIIDVDAGLINAARNGTPEAMLPRIEAARDAVGSKIGDITAASPASIHPYDIDAAIHSVASKYEENAATYSAGKSIRDFGDRLSHSLGLQRQADGSLLRVREGIGVPIQDLIRERKAIDKMVFENAALDPSMTIEVKRELRGKLEGLIMDGLDEASGKLPGEQKAEYKSLKHDYTALSIASDAAEDSAARMSKAATFGLTDTIRGGGSIIKTGLSKVVREHGNAAAAVLLSRMADMGTITRAVKGVDDQIGKAAKGLLNPPTARPLPETRTGTVQQRAERVMRAVADFQANPEAHAEAITRRTEALATTTPELAGVVAQRMTSAMAFLASKVPVTSDPDPFDPHAAPKLNDGQAHELAEYGWYIEKPARFFVEVEHGKITPEGVEVAKLTMPRAFEQLQSETAAALATMLSDGKRPLYEQQRRLGALLEFPATPDQRPEHMPFLQSNVAVPVASGKLNGVAAAPKRPLKLASQQSSLDRLSENGPGRR